MIDLLAAVVSLGLAAGAATAAPAPLPTRVLTTDDGRAFVELAAPGGAVYWREPVRIVVRFGLDAGFFAEQALPLFLQEFELPVQLEVPWLGGLPGVADLGAATPGDGEDRVGLAVGDGRGAARPAGERLVDGRHFDVYELAFDVVPDRAGTVTLPAPALRYAWTRGFREDLLADRVPLDHHESRVTAQPVVLTVLPLPEKGRPAAFVDAVGPFTALTAEAEPRVLAAGQAVMLTLTFAGRGARGAFEPPRLDELPGFVLASQQAVPPLDEPADPRRVVYELVPFGPQVQAVPPVEFACFDTTPPAGWRVLRTEAIPLQVTPRAGAAPPRTGTGAEDGTVDAAGDAGVPVVVAVATSDAGEGAARHPPAEASVPEAPSQPQGHVGLLILLGLAALVPAVVAGALLIRRHRAR